MIGSELVSYNKVKFSPSRTGLLTGVQRRLFGTGTKGSLKGKRVYPAGFCGNIMVVCATGHVVTVLL